MKKTSLIAISTNDSVHLYAAFQSKPIWHGKQCVSRLLLNFIILIGLLITTGTAAASITELKQANALIEANQLADAKELLLKLIKQHPDSPEPYNNLAALEIKQGNANTAKRLLEKALMTDTSYALSYKNLRSLNQALALNAYRKSLNLIPDRTPLPNLQPSLQWSKAKTIVEKPVEVVKTVEKIIEVEKPVEVIKVVEKPIEVIKTVEKIVEVEKPVEVIKVVEKPVEVIKTVEKIVEVEKPVEVIKIVEKPVEVIKIVEKIVEVEKLSTTVPTTKTDDPIHTTDSADNTILPTQTPADSNQNKTLTPSPIDAVKSWVQAWAGQDVPNYINHYIDSYSSQPSQSHQTWARLRQERITKPKFIKIKLYNIKVDTIDSNTVTVTFDQQYQSNLVNDTVTKKLTLIVQAGKWKISEEDIL